MHTSNTECLEGKGNAPKLIGSFEFVWFIRTDGELSQ